MKPVFHITGGFAESELQLIEILRVRSSNESAGKDAIFLKLCQRALNNSLRAIVGGNRYSGSLFSERTLKTSRHHTSDLWSMVCPLQLQCPEGCGDNRWRRRPDRNHVRHMKSAPGQYLAMLAVSWSSPEKGSTVGA